MEDSDKEFKKVNNRSDVQAFRSAFVIFKNGVHVIIDYPEKKRE